MKNLIILIYLLCHSVSGYSQKNKIITVPLKADKWEFQSQKVEFEKADGKQTMKLLPNAGKVVLKDLNFSSGTIEFDIQPIDPVFSFLYFRYQNADENECFYFRNARAGHPLAPDAIQYAPFLSGVNFWDMLPHYQTNADFKKGEWNHVKLEISEAQMRVYVNSEVPILEVPKLEGNTNSGTIAFEGQMVISDLKISHAEVEGLTHKRGIDPTDYDPRYIRTWRVTHPITTPDKIDFSYDFMPNDSTKWEDIKAESRGLVNLTRKFGKSEDRRISWLKVTIKSDKAQKRKIDLGFSDEVWVFLNGQMIYIDKNLYNQPMMKEPDGRISIKNASFEVDLLEGFNDLKIGVTNNFFGWGIIARLDKIDGIQLINDDAVYFNGRKMITLNEQILEKYLGSYVQDGKKLLIAREENALKISGDDLPTILFFPETETKFFIKEANVHMEFLEDENKRVSSVKFFENGNEIFKYDKLN